MSGCVALRLPSAGAVVTYFVTGSRTPRFKRTTAGPGEPRVQHDHSAMTGESCAVARICERALQPPVKVCPSRWPPWPPASPPNWRAGSARRGCGAWLGGVDGHRQTCVGGQFHRRSSGRGRRQRVMEVLDLGVVEAEVMRGPPGAERLAACRRLPPLSPDRSRLCPRQTADCQVATSADCASHSTGAARPGGSQARFS